MILYNKSCLVVICHKRNSANIIITLFIFVIYFTIAGICCIFKSTRRETRHGTLPSKLISCCVPPCVLCVTSQCCVIRHHIVPRRSYAMVQFPCVFCDATWRSHENERKCRPSVKWRRARSSYFLRVAMIHLYVGASGWLGHLGRPSGSVRLDEHTKKTMSIFNSITICVTTRIPHHMHMNESQMIQLLGIHTYTRTHTHRQAYTHTNTPKTHIHIRACTHAYVHTHTYPHTRALTNMHIRVRTRIHTTHACTYTN